MQQGGWVKIPRSFINGQYSTDHQAFVIFMYLVGNANVAPYEKYPYGRVERGQIVVSVSTLSSRLKIDPERIRRRLKKLEFSGEITMRATNKFHVITINDFESYQPLKKASDKQTTSERQASDKEITSNQQDSDKQATTIKENNISVDTDNYFQNESEKNLKKNFFSKKGKKEKEIFQIPEIVAELAKKKIYMTAAGLAEFKENNESDSTDFNYNGGIANAAKFFLKKFPQYVGEKPKPEKTQYETLEVSARVKYILQSIRDQFTAADWQTWIEPLKLQMQGEDLCIWCPTKFFAEYVDKNFQPQLTMLKNQLKFKKIYYKLEVN